MRIRELDLRRIGPFTNQTLTFDQGEFGLHLVYGANEAGKSSSLRALTHWLFGMPGETTSRDHFVHAYKDLRIGGTIENHEGETLTCIRRYGGQASLRGENDRTKIDPSVLSAFLGGLTREQFETQFGIDIHQLVAGGRAIASGGGEIGESLFAAGSGAANMPAIQQQLDKQCGDLFKLSGTSKPKINAAITQLNAARKEVRDTSIKSKDWQHRFDELAELRKTKSELDQQQIELHSEKERLRRIQDALPAIGEWNDRRHELAELGDVVRLRSDFTSQRVEVTTRLAEAQATQKVAVEEQRSLTEKIDQLGQQPKILDHASAVESLLENLSLYRQWVQSSPTISAQCQQLQTRAKDALRTLGKEPQLDQADGLRINPATRVRIRDLAEERSGLLASADKAKRDLGRRTAELEKLTNRLSAMEQPADPTSLKKAIAAAQKLGDLDTMIEAKSVELEQSNRSAEETLHRLTLWSGGLDELQLLTIPTPETVARFASDFERIDREIGQLDDELKRLDDETSAAEESLHALTIGADVPTEESLTQTRELRDQRWHDLQELVQAPLNSDDKKETSDITPLQDAMQSVTELVRQSDEISDRLRREAQAVSDKARLLGVLQRCRTQTKKRTTTRNERQSEREALSEAWQAEWHRASIAALSPTEMTGWLSRHAELMQSAAQIRQHDANLNRQQRLRAEHVIALRNHLDDSTIDDSRLSPVLDACVDRSEASVALINEYQQLEKQIADLQTNTADAEATWTESEQAKSVWQQQWQVAMVSLDSDGELTAKEAQAVLDTIDQLITDIDSASKLEDQLKTNEQQIEAFEKRVVDLAQSLGMKSDEQSPEQRVADWNDQLKGARKDETSREHLRLQLSKVEKQRQTTAADIEIQSASLQQLCNEAKCDSAEQLPEIEQRSQECQKIGQTIAEKAGELRGLAQDKVLKTFIEEASKEDADRLTPRIDQLSQELEQIEQERDNLFRTIVNQENELKKIDGSDAAAIANERVEETIAQIETHLEDYVRTKLGAMMLRKAVARYRKRNQGPILARASELFARFTLGGFSGLDTDSNDNLENVLVGVRSSGDDSGTPQLITVDEMSEGTCDQLFLALRIASLEWHLASSPPVPFIVDDILLKFDDERSAATLECLGELSSKTQVIMFTHHRHLIDVAQKAVPADVLHVHSLGGPIYSGELF